MNANGFDNHAHELLRAAERSLFDATIRLEEALAAMDGRRPEDAQAVLEQARQWSQLIARGLERMEPTRLPTTVMHAPPAIRAKARPVVSPRLRALAKA